MIIVHNVLRKQQHLFIQITSVIWMKRYCYLFSTLACTLLVHSKFFLTVSYIPLSSLLYSFWLAISGLTHHMNDETVVHEVNINFIYFLWHFYTRNSAANIITRCSEAFNSTKFIMISLELCGLWWLPVNLCSVMSASFHSAEIKKMSTLQFCGFTGSVILIPYIMAVKLVSRYDAFQILIKNNRIRKKFLS